MVGHQCFIIKLAACRHDNNKHGPFRIYLQKLSLLSSVRRFLPGTKSVREFMFLFCTSEIQTFRKIVKFETKVKYIAQIEEVEVLVSFIGNRSPEHLVANSQVSSFESLCSVTFNS